MSRLMGSDPGHLPDCRATLILIDVLRLLTQKCYIVRPQSLVMWRPRQMFPIQQPQKGDWNADTLPYIGEPRMPLIVVVELLDIPIEDAESVI